MGGVAHPGQAKRSQAKPDQCKANAGASLAIPGQARLRCSSSMRMS